MLGWLDSLVGVVTGTFSDIWKKVVSLVKTVFSWVSAEIVILRNDFESVYNDVIHLSDSIANFVYRTYNVFVQWVDKTFGDVLHWAEAEIGNVEKYAESIAAWAVKQLDSISKWVTGLFNQVESWVISKVWNPLWTSITSALNWIENEGAYAYDLLTHPDKLALLLIGYLWLSWLTLFKAYAKPIVSYILNSLRGNIPDLVSVLEDIITSIL
jgi:hypothetical protein